MIFHRSTEAWQTIAPLDFLGELLSEISEQAYAAGWLGGTEYFVPELSRRAIAENRIQYWGFSFIGPDLGSRLFQIAKHAGSWVVYDNPDIFVPFNPFPVPAEYLEHLSHRPQARTETALPSISPKHLQLFLESGIGKQYLQGVELLHP